PRFYRNTLAPFVRSLSPWVATPFLTSSMLVSVLLGVKQHSNVAEMVVTDFASRSRIDHRTGRRKTRTERTWTEEALEEVVELLEQNNRWLHSIAFTYRLRKVRDEGYVLGEGYVSRSCTFRCKRSAGWLLAHAAIGLIDQVAQKHGFFKDRGRQSRN